jgi:hypothetical protein
MANGTSYMAQILNKHFKYGCGRMLSGGLMLAAECDQHG